MYICILIYIYINIYVYTKRQRFYALPGFLAAENTGTPYDQRRPMRRALQWSRGGGAGIS